MRRSTSIGSCGVRLLKSNVAARDGSLPGVIGQVTLHQREESLGLLPERHVTGIGNYLEPGIGQERDERCGDGDRKWIPVTVDDERGPVEGTQPIGPVVSVFPQA